MNRKFKRWQTKKKPQPQPKKEGKVMGRMVLDVSAVHGEELQAAKETLISKMTSLGDRVAGLARGTIQEREGSFSTEASDIIRQILAFHAEFLVTLSKFESNCDIEAHPPGTCTLATIAMATSWIVEKLQQVERLVSSAATVSSMEVLSQAGNLGEVLQEIGEIQRRALEQQGPPDPKKEPVH
jgi:hypothetical protein